MAALLGAPPGSEYCYLACMAVAPDQRRGGAASSLLAAALMVAREWGFEYAALHVYVGNAPARALYERCGWTGKKPRPPQPPTFHSTPTPQDLISLEEFPLKSFP